MPITFSSALAISGNRCCARVRLPRARDRPSGILANIGRRILSLSAESSVDRITDGPYVMHNSIRIWCLTSRSGVGRPPKRRPVHSLTIFGMRCPHSVNGCRTTTALVATGQGTPRSDTGTVARIGGMTTSLLLDCTVVLSHAQSFGSDRDVLDQCQRNVVRHRWSRGPTSVRHDQGTIAGPAQLRCRIPFHIGDGGRRRLACSTLRATESHSTDRTRSSKER